MLIAIAATAVYIYNNQNDINKEKSEYEFALSSSDISVLEKYIETYSDTDAPTEHILMIKNGSMNCRRQTSHGQMQL